MAQTSYPHVGKLLRRAQKALGLSQTTFGELLGASRASIGRWQASAALRLTPQALRILVGRVHPIDAALAAELASAHDHTLASLGVGEIAEAARSNGVARAHLVDAIVCAAADAASQTPASVRPIVRAAFERARDVGLDVEQVLAAFGGRADV